MATTELEFFVLEPRGGRLIPRFDLCGLTTAQGIRAYNEALGSTSVLAADALRDLEGPLSATVASMDAAISQLDRLLSQNPDATTPSSTAELMAAVGGLTPTRDREALERRVADILDLNVVNGVLFPKGATDLGPLRALFRALGIAGTGCVLPSLDDDFIMVTSVQETTETTTRSVCGDDVSEFAVTERRVGTNVSIAMAAQLAGVPESEILVRFFWIDVVNADGPTLRRLKALGLQGQDLTDVVLLQQGTRVQSRLVDSTALQSLRDGELTDDEICTMMNRPDNRGGVNVTPTADQVVGAIQSAINANTGANRNRAGLSDDAILADPQGTAPAGRAGDPALLLASVVKLGRSLRIDTTPNGPVIGGFGNLPDPVAFRLDGGDVPFPTEPEACRALMLLLYNSINTVTEFLSKASGTLQGLSGQLGLGIHSLQTGLEYTSCLVSFNLGLNVSLDIAASLPFLMETFLGLFSGLLAAVSTAVTTIKSLLCLPQALISLLFGGICGFRPFDFTICDPDVRALVERLQRLINLALSLIGQVLSSLQTMKVDLQAGLRQALDLKTFSVCAAGILPAAIVLQLGGADLTGELNASASGQTAGGQEFEEAT